MDVYTSTNFRKKQASIFKTVLKQNQPVEVTTGSTKTNGASEGVVIVSKDDYQNLMALKSQLVQQATTEIQEMVLRTNPATLTDLNEIEAWLDED